MLRGREYSRDCRSSLDGGLLSLAKVTYNGFVGLVLVARVDVLGIMFER
jgi:hypothetical protein